MMTGEELKQHDEEYRIRKQYWHLLVFVDAVRDYEATEDMHRDEIGSYTSASKSMTSAAHVTPLTTSVGVQVLESRENKERLNIKTVTVGQLVVGQNVFMRGRQYGDGAR